MIYGEDLNFKGVGHGSTLDIIPVSKAKDMASKLPEVPNSPSNHFASLLKSAQGKETCRSCFAVVAPLSQMMCLGVTAQWLDRPVRFGRKTRQILNDEVANALQVI